MRIRNEGDSIRAYCEQCGRLVSGQYRYRDFTLTSPKAIVVPDVLIGVCGTCGEPISVPPQSMPKINAARKAERESIQFEARMPRSLEDVLAATVQHYRGRPEILSAPLVRFYLEEVGRDEAAAQAVKAASEHEAAAGVARGRLSIRLDKELWETAWSHASHAGVENKSALARGVIVLSAMDAKLIKAPKDAAAAKRRRFLETLSAVLGG